MESLGPPLWLLPARARWFSYRLVLIYREVFDVLYRELWRGSDSATVDAVTFWEHALPLLYGTHEKPGTPNNRSCKRSGRACLRLTSCRAAYTTPAMNCGSYQLVMGVLHPGTNTLGTPTRLKPPNQIHYTTEIHRS